MLGASIEGNLYLRDARSDELLDLAGARVASELHLYGAEGVDADDWGQDFRLDLVGFSYNLSPAVAALPAADLHLWHRSAVLLRPHRSSAAIPAVGLGATREGFADTADRIMVKSHNHRLFGRSSTSLPRRTVLLAQLLVIRYGYDNWVAVFWFFGLLMVGMGVLKHTEEEFLTH